MKPTGLTYIINDLSLIRKDLIGDNSIIIKMDDPDSVVGVFRKFSSDFLIDQMILDIGYGCLSQIPFNSDWENIPLTILAYNLGELNDVLNTVGLLQASKLFVFLPASNDETYSSLKILASLGINCGIKFDSGPIDDERFLDLASYYYMSPVPHASIEPFANIKTHLHANENHSFDEVYNIDGRRFVYLLNDCEVSFTPEGKRLSLSMSEKELEKEQIDYKLENYYCHFMSLDKCSKCQAYKICNHSLSEFFRNDCEGIMTEVFEYAELGDNIKR